VHKRLLKKLLNSLQLMKHFMY